MTRAATDIRNEMTILFERNKEIQQELSRLSADQVEHYMLSLELADIRDNLKMLREDFQNQVEWDNQNISDK